MGESTLSSIVVIGSEGCVSVNLLVGALSSTRVRLCRAEERWSPGAYRSVIAEMPVDRFLCGGSGDGTVGSSSR